MLKKTKQTKVEKIAEGIRGQILNGTFVGDRLPSRLELADHFQVSHQTIDSVLKRLREEGLIRGVRGTGIFVNRSIDNVTNLTNRLVLMLLPPHSIYESEPFESLRAESIRRGLIPVNLDTVRASEFKPTLQEKATIHQIVNAPIRGILYHGRGGDKMLYEVKRNIRSVALIFYDSDDDPPGSSLLLDFRSAGYKMARHFIEQGARKLLVLGGIIRNFAHSELYWKRHPITQMREGATAAAADAGIPLPEFYNVQKLPDGEDGAISFKEAEPLLRKYDGIITSYDRIAYTLMRYAQQLKISVPDDLLVSGFYDTGWSHLFDYQITSVSENPVELSNRALDMLETGGIRRELIVPDMVIRTSSLRK